MLPRIALVLVATCALFLTLAVAVQASQINQALAIADVAVIKGDANPNVRPGGTLTYRIFYENLGTAPATDVVITDTLPAYTKHLQNNAGSQSWTAAISDTMVVWRRDVISPATSDAFDVLLKVSEDAPAGTVIVNQVEIATTATETVSMNNVWTTQPSVVRVADVWVDKAGPAEVSSGDRITYTIDYGNEGSDVADNVVITDTLPAGVTYLESQGTAGSPAVNGRNVVWQVGNLAASAAATMTLVGQVDTEQPSLTTLTNTVTITTQTPEKDYADDAGTWTTWVRAGPPDSVQISLPPTMTVRTSETFTTEVRDRWANPVADGTTVTFTANSIVTPDASAVTAGGMATATLSAGTDVGMAVVTATAGSVVGTGALEVAPGPVGQIKPRATPGMQTVGEPVTVRTEVLDSFGNPVRAGIGVTFSTTLGEVQPPAADTDSAGIVTATLTSTRTGTALVSAYSHGVQGSAPALFNPGPTENITATADPPAIPVDGATSQVLATLTDRYGNRVGDGITVTFDTSLGVITPMTATTAAGHATAVLTSGPIHGQAAVTVTSGIYTGTTAVDLLPADLKISSTNTPGGDILPGTAVTYTITYENAGSAVAKDVVISDTLPANFIEVSYESSGAAITATQGSDSILWAVEDLSPEEGGTIILRGRFDPDRQWPSSEFVSNVARISCTTAEGNPADNTASSGNLILTTNVYIQSTVDNAGTDLTPGGKIKYLVFFGNYEPTAAQGITITDILPAYTSLWQHSAQEVPGLTHVSEDNAPVQVWRYDGPVQGPNFGNFYVWLNIAANAPGGMLLHNRIEIATDTPEGNYSDNFSETERRLEGINLEANLVAQPTVVPDRLITYTLSYSNTGTLAAENVTLTGVVPAGVSVVDVSRTPASVEPEGMQWEIGSVGPGQRGLITVVGRVDTDVEAGRTLHASLNIATTSSESFAGDNTSEVDTQVLPDAPDSLTLVMEPATMAVGTEVPLQISVVDQFGNPIDGLTVTLSTTAGVVTPTVTATSQGTAAATFTAPTAPARGTLTAESAGLSDAVAFTVEPGEPSDLRLEADAETLPADGHSTTIVRARVTDEYGNSVEDATPVRFTTNLGTLYLGQRQHTVGTLDGIASTVLTAGRTSGPATITAMAGTVTEQIVVEFQAVDFHHLYLPLVVSNRAES